MKADAYAYRDRRNRKRDFRRLWITRINAAARENGMSYSQFIHGLGAGRHRAGPQGAGRHRRARPRDLPPIRRRRPRGVGCLIAARRRNRPPGRRSSRTAPFFVSMTITSTTNQHLTEIRKLGRARARARAAAASSPRARISMRRLTPPAGRRSMCSCAQGHESAGRAGWLEVEPALLAGVSALGSGIARDRRLRAALERAAPARCASRCGASATPATSARSCAPRTPSARRAWRSARAAPTPTGPRRCARRWVRSSPSRSRASRASRSCRGRLMALVPRAGEALRGPLAGEVTLLVGAERDGTAGGGRSQQCDELARSRGRRRVAERGDGRDGRAVRGD